MNTTETIATIIATTPWGFMSPEIIRDRNVLLVETMNGMECVPGDTLGLPDPPSIEDDESCQSYATKVSDYCQGGIVDVESACQPMSGYVCRMSASGYMDCSEWIFCETESDVLRWLESEAEQVQ